MWFQIGIKNVECDNAKSVPDDIDRLLAIGTPFGYHLSDAGIIRSVNSFKIFWIFDYPLLA